MLPYRLEHNTTLCHRIPACVSTQIHADKRSQPPPSERSQTRKLRSGTNHQTPTAELSSSSEERRSSDGQSERQDINKHEKKKKHKNTQKRSTAGTVEHPIWRSRPHVRLLMYLPSPPKKTDENSRWRKLITWSSQCLKAEAQRDQNVLLELTLAIKLTRGLFSFDLTLHAHR